MADLHFYCRIKQEKLSRVQEGKLIYFKATSCFTSCEMINVENTEKLEGSTREKDISECGV